jgi:hypothetical protein
MDPQIKINVFHKYLISTFIIVILSLSSTMSIQQQTAGSQKDNLIVELTFIEGQSRNVSDARVYIQEYPQYGTNPPDGSSIDLNDAFYNDDPYTGIWKDEIVVPSGVIKVGEEFHACIEDTNTAITLACFKLKNAEKGEPEKLTIDFNNFP